jgi:hypothetical protein
MCKELIESIKKLFRIPTGDPCDPPVVIPEPPVVIPPEPVIVPMDELLKRLNENQADGDTIDESVTMREDWMEDWEVPEEHQPFWWEIQIRIVENYIYPASITYLSNLTESISDNFLFTLNPFWDTKGVCAHEMAHVSKKLMTTEQWKQFESISSALMTTNDLLIALFQRNGYGLTSVVERHAEIYRYLGQYMPEELKQFYPKMF